MNTPNPHPKTHVVTAPAHITVAVVTAALAAANVAVLTGGMMAVVIDCSGVTACDAASIATLVTFAQTMRLQTASVHLYNIPPFLCDLLGANHLAFSSCSA